MASTTSIQGSLAHAHSVRVDTLNHTNANNVYQMNPPQSRSPMDRLLDNIAPGAVHNADDRWDSPKCHPETRVALQQNILSWIAEGDRDTEPKKIMWITGPAGSGKTAIAGTIAEICHQQRSLAAGFFFSAFSKSRYRRSKRCLIPTLVYQLMQHPGLDGLKEQILRRIERDPVVFQKRLKEQVEVLILRPLRSLPHRVQTNTPMAVIIDGLDECEADLREGWSSTEVGAWRSKEEVHQEILSALLQAMNDPVFPFRIVIFSRPDPAIEGFFEAVAPSTLQIFLDDNYQPDADISLFFRAKFAELRRRYRLPQGWPKEPVITTLIEQASGQFIYPATIMRFIESSAEPTKQLKRILEWRASDSQSSPFAALDDLYSGILNTSPAPTLAVKWIHAFKLLQQDMPSLRNEESTSFIRSFLESTEGEMMGVLGKLTSLLSLEGTANRPGFHVYHKTLLDFLTDRSRCRDLYVAQAEQYQLLKSRWYNVLKGRGFQVPIASPELERRFLNVYAQMPRTWPMVRFVDPRRGYSIADVEWWLRSLGSFSVGPCVDHIRHEVHLQCPWYRCLPSCKVWKKRMDVYIKQNPTTPTIAKSGRFSTESR